MFIWQLVLKSVVGNKDPNKEERVTKSPNLALGYTVVRETH